LEDSRSAPRLAVGAKNKLRPGTGLIVTVQPGIMCRDGGGVRLQTTCGYPAPVTKFSPMAEAARRTVCWILRDGTPKLVTTRSELPAGIMHEFESRYHSWRQSFDCKKVRQVIELMNEARSGRDDLKQGDPNAFASGRPEDAMIVAMPTLHDEAPHRVYRGGDSRQPIPPRRKQVPLIKSPMVGTFLRRLRTDHAAVCQSWVIAWGQILPYDRREAMKASPRDYGPECAGRIVAVLTQSGGRRRVQPALSALSLN